MNKLFRALIFALLFFMGSSWLSFQMATPLFISLSELEKVRFSWFGLPIIGTFAFTGLMGAVVFSLLYSLMKRTQIMRSAKFILIPAFLMGCLGLIVNYANYYIVIQPNNLSPCPAKIGYGKNLLVDYVKDVSFCEK